jgi:DNA-binding GntR family transcriptional regulator
MPDAREPLKDLVGDLDFSTRRSLAEDVVDRLRKMIVRGVFDGGQHLSEVALAETFEVSRGPIREAFVALEREGLLKLERHRGARITVLSQADIDEIYTLRTALERLAVERAVRYATDENFAAMDDAVSELKQAVKAGDVHRVVELDVRFHDLIYQAAHHSRLYLAWSTLRPQIETFLHTRSADGRNYLTKAVREHGELRDVIRSKSKRNATTMIDAHLRSAYERLTKQLSS